MDENEKERTSRLCRIYVEDDSCFCGFFGCFSDVKQDGQKTMGKKNKVYELTLEVASLL